MRFLDPLSRQPLAATLSLRLRGRGDYTRSERRTIGSGGLPSPDIGGRVGVRGKTPAFLLFIKQGWIILTLLLLTGCAQSSGGGDPAEAVERYLRALVNKDESYISGICAEWEVDARTEFDSFGAVSASIEDMQCTAGDADGDYRTVNCTGSMEVIYGGENTRNFDLARTPYRVKQEDGAWRMCGYAP